MRGYGLGVLLKNNMDIDTDDAARIIKAINDVKHKEITKILLDSYYKLHPRTVEKIEDECQLTILKGRSVLLSLLPYVIMKLCDYNKVEINEQELLIIGNDDDNTRTITNKLAEKTNYLVLFGENSDFLDVLSKEVVMDTGLSIHTIHKLSNNLRRYNFIINLQEEPNMNISSIKKKTIVFDLSQGKELSNNIRTVRKDILAISDFILNRTNTMYCDDSKYSFDKEIVTSIYIGINENVCKDDFRKIKVGDKAYSIKQACDLFLTTSSSASNFYVKY